MKTTIAFIIALFMLITFGHFVASCITHTLTLASFGIHITVFILMGIVELILIASDAPVVDYDTDF